MNQEIFGNKYAIQHELASKGGRKTLLARDITNEELVVIKLLAFSNDITWEDLKLFEREAETLKSIAHDSIPSYIDYFEIERENNKGFALVQAYIDAPSLEQQIQAGRGFSEAEVKELAKALLNILDYLHSRQPSIIHRDIKPSNILLGNSIDDIYLVDFGSVQNLANKKGGTITVVGTYGYMPPEQFGGRAKPASDLYSLGTTFRS
jgi:serine/threonine protein kinase